MTLGYFGISQYKTDFIVNPINSQGFLQNYVMNINQKTKQPGFQSGSLEVVLYL